MNLDICVRKARTCKLHEKQQHQQQQKNPTICYPVCIYGIIVRHHSEARIAPRHLKCELLSLSESTTFHFVVLLTKWL